MHNVLVVFSSGLCVLWNQHQGCILQKQINKDAETSVCVKISGKTFSVQQIFVCSYTCRCVNHYMLGGLVLLKYPLLVLMASLGGFNMVIQIRVGIPAKLLLHVMAILKHQKTIAASYIFFKFQGCQKVSRV